MRTISRRHMHVPLAAALFMACLAARLAAADAIERVVLFRFAEGASPASVRAALDEIESLPSKFPGIRGLQWGTNSSPEKLNKGFTHGLLFSFASQADVDSFMADPRHAEMAERIRPVLADLFVFDIAVPAPPPPAEPGRVHHLVFFKFKEGAPKEEIDRVNEAFAALQKKVSGCLSYESGPDAFGQLAKGFQRGYLLSFVNDRARDDYLIHPAHKEFGKQLGPVLDDVLVLDFGAVPSSRGLFITEGLEPYAVYARGADGTADLRFSGVSREDGPIEARLRAGRRTVPGFDWKAAGKAEEGKFSAALEKVPAGGEYTVEVRRKDRLGNVAEHTEVANVLVGDIWVLAGQSNMEGVGDLVDVEEPTPLVHCFTMAHRWELAVEPLHWLIDSPDPVHSGGALANLDEEGRRARRSEARAHRTKGAGLGLPFAKEMARHTGIPVGLVAAAHGGTSMEQWDPAGRDNPGGMLYGSMLKQVKNAGGHPKGVLWYQGESDANPQAAPLFLDRFKALVAAMRQDFGSPELPFYYVQIGRFVREGDGVPWNRIQELQRLAEAEIPGTGMISVIDLALDDLIHVGTPGLKRAGRRLARIAQRELFGVKGIERGPRLAGVELSPDRRTVLVRYAEVNGSLLPLEKVEGFIIRKKEGGELKTIYNASVDRNERRSVILKLQDAVPEGATLSYGPGLDPTANLIDAEDMAAPVFGPVEVK